MRQRKKNKLSPLGMLIKTRMLVLGMSQEQLARAIRCHVNYLGHILYGRRPGGKYLDAIEKALGISLGKFKKSA